MAGLFGGGKSQSATVPVLNGIQITQSTYGNAMPLVYGQVRIPGTLGWYGAFTSTPVSSGGGGKGGGNSGPTSYNYSASFILLLCEGPINGVATTYADKAVHVGANALTDFQFTIGYGTVGQAVWPYLTTNFPTQAIGYSSTAYLGTQNYGLGGSASLPNLTFEVQGLLWASLSFPYKTPSGTGTFTGTVTVNSNVITGIASVTGPGLATGAILTGGGLSSDPTVPTVITNVLSPTSVTISGQSTGSATETIGYSVTGGDLDPASILGDYCTDPTHGCSFPFLDANLTTGVAGSFVGTSVGGQPTVTLTSGFPAVPQLMPGGTVFAANAAFPSGCTLQSYDPVAHVATMTTNASAGTSATYGYGLSTWQAYCIAQGFYVSVAETTQRPAQDFITELMTITNSDAIWTGGSLKLIPLADSPVSGNTATYTPNNGAGGAFTTPIFSFADDDFIHDASGDPVVVTRKGVSDTYNKVRVEFLDRGNQYNTAIAEAFDANDIAVNGERVMSTVTLHNICDAAVARRVAQYVLQRQLYYKNSYQFKLRGDYCLLEPLDIVGLNDSGLGLVNALVRLDSVEIDENDEITIDATELPFGPGNTPQYNYQFGSRTGLNTNVAPSPVTAPVIFMAPPLLVATTGGYEIWIALAGASNWGGCAAYMSNDGITYSLAGNITAPATYGAVSLGIPLVADPDTTSTLQATLAAGSGTPNASSHAEADNMRSLALLWDTLSDPVFASVVLLLHFDGTAGSTSFPDSSTFGNNATAHGNAQLETTMVLSGTASLSLPDTLTSANTYFSVPVVSGGSMDVLPAGDFTLEFWVYPIGASNAYVALYHSQPFAGAASGFALYVGTATLLGGVCQVISGATGPSSLGGTGIPVSHDVWHYVAMVRQGSNARLWLDGVAAAGMANNWFPSSFGTTPASSIFEIGILPGTPSASVQPCYVDEVRITSGVARFNPAANSIPVPPVPFGNRLSNPEVISYGAASLVSAGVYDFTYLRRGLYGTPDIAHTTHDSFVRLDNAIFKVPFDPGMAGQTVYFKFASLNQYQMNLQSLASATAYQYTIPSPAFMNALLPTNWITHGPYTALAGTIAKSITGSASWTDGFVASQQAYMHGCALTGRANASLVAGANVGVAMGLTTAPAANYTGINYAWINQGATGWTIYESGTLIANLGAVSTGDVVGIIWDGNIVRYYLNGALKRGVKWANVAPVFAQVSIFTPGASLESADYQLVTTQQVQDGDYLNTWPWKIGTSGSQGNYYDNAIAGGGTLSTIVYGGTGTEPLDPYGLTAPLWKSFGNTNATLGGGWSNDAQHIVADIQGIDPTKTYRSCVWFRIHGTISGNFYHGIDWTVATTLAGAALTQATSYFNFIGLPGSLVADKWYLSVGFIHGSTYGTTATGIGGVYDPATGTQLYTANEFKQIAGMTNQGHAVFQAYANNSAMVMYACRPRFEEVTGQEPPIAMLLSPNGALAYLNQADTANIVVNAATTTVITTLGSASTTFTTASVNDAVDCTASYTNTTTGTITVEISYSTMVTVTSNNANTTIPYVDVFWDGTGNGGGVAGELATANHFLPGPYTNTSVRSPKSYVDYYSLNAGQTLSISVFTRVPINVGAGGYSATVLREQVVLRIAAIKR